MCRSSLIPESIFGETPILVPQKPTAVHPTPRRADAQKLLRL